MKHISIMLDDETVAQIRDLAEQWGLPAIRHNTDVVRRCVERVWREKVSDERKNLEHRREVA